MPDGTSLINLGDLGKPVEKLVEVVSAGIGKLYEPRAIMAKARAEAEARLIAAATEDELAERAVRRVIFQERRRQENIEAIVGESVKALPATVSDTPVDPDWTARFFEAAQDVSDEQLRAVWAKILAGEIHKPGAFSRRTLSMLREMSPAEAELFGRACSRAWTEQDGDAFLPRLVDPQGTEEFVVSVQDLLDLEALGLIQFKNDIYIDPDPPVIGYFGREFLCEPIVKGDPFRVDVYTFTRAAQELRLVTGVTADEDYFVSSQAAIALTNAITMTPLQSGAAANL